MGNPINNSGFFDKSYITLRLILLKKIIENVIQCCKLYEIKMLYLFYRCSIRLNTRNLMVVLNFNLLAKMFNKSFLGN